MTRFPATQGTGGVVSGLPCAGPITTYFGVRDELHPVGHAGVDIGAPAGKMIWAPAGGTCRKVWLDHPVYGNAVELLHPDGVATIYMHMQGAPYSREGDEVKHGEWLGVVGSTGFTTGPHLHWGMAPAGKADFNYPSDTGPVGVLLNPLDYCGEEPIEELDPVIDVEEIALIQDLLKKFVIGGAVTVNKVRGSNPTEYRLVVH